jgi:hypothetical protein
MAEPVGVQPPKSDPNGKLVRVFDAEEETEALVVKGLLETAGIESDLTPLSLTQYAFPNVGGTIILVREEDAEAARRLIADYQRPANESGGNESGRNESGIDEDETAEIDLSQIDISEEPPPKA